MTDSSAVDAWDGKTLNDVARELEVGGAFAFDATFAMNATVTMEATAFPVQAEESVMELVEAARESGASVLFERELHKGVKVIWSQVRLAGRVPVLVALLDGMTEVAAKARQ